MEVKSESEVAHSCQTRRDSMGCSLPGSSVRGIFQARALEWGAIELYAKHVLIFRLSIWDWQYNYLHLENRDTKADKCCLLLF